VDKKETLKNITPNNHLLDLIRLEGCEVNVKVAREQTDEAD
jgi:hypothetical protein